MEPPTGDPDVAGMLIVRCACGWEVRGSEAKVVRATRDHGRRLHNMEATREQVLAMAVRRDPPRRNPDDAAS